MDTFHFLLQVMAGVLILKWVDPDRRENKVAAYALAIVLYLIFSIPLIIVGLFELDILNLVDFM